MDKDIFLATLSDINLDQFPPENLFDVAEYITHHGESPSLDIDLFMKEWGVDINMEHKGGVNGVEPIMPDVEREVFLLQRKKSKVGKNLGKTTGWIHRSSLKNRNVLMLNSCSYERIDEEGFHILVNDEPKTLPVDTVIICAGQEPLRELQEGLETAGESVHLIGGADVAAELDAKRAINQGARLAASL